MVDWIFSHLGTLVFLFVVISIVRKVRGVVKDAEEQTNRRTSARPIANVDPDEAERVRKIQEEIRRKIAERRGDLSSARTPEVITTAPERPPLLRPTGTPPIDPFGGPLRRVLTELERRAEARTEEPPVVSQSAREDAAQELKRQRQIAERLRLVRESRDAARQQEVTTARDAMNEPGKEAAATATAVRGALLADLRDPRGLRRAMVLREILGTPVGLR